MSRNMVFNEASLWWSLQATLLPNSKKIKEQMQKQIEIRPTTKEVPLTQEKVNATPLSSQDKARSLDKEKNPW